MSDRVRNRWVAGEVALNAWSTFGGASAAGVLASAGFDAVTVDLQHGEQTLEGLGDVAGAIERAGAVPCVRIGWNDPATVMRALDLGARGVICPMVDTAEDAAAFVRFCRYPPLGARSYGPVRSAFGTGRRQTDVANESALAFAQIETSEGWANVEAICATAGLDGVYVGPADLSLALGFESFADLSAPDMSMRSIGWWPPPRLGAWCRASTRRRSSAPSRWLGVASGSSAPPATSSSCGRARPRASNAPEPTLAPNTDRR